MKTQWRKNTAYFLGSQLVSLFGSSLVQYAIVWHITLTTKSGLYATLAVLCGFLPTFLLSPFGGVWADRYQRKKLIMLADGGIALASLILVVIFAWGYQPIWLMLTALSVRALGAAIQNPSVGALLPDIVPTDKLTRVNGLNSSLQSLNFLISPMAAGVLYANASLQNIFMIDVLTAALAIGILLIKVKVPQLERKTDKHDDYIKELLGGLRYIRNLPFLRNLFVFMAALLFLGAPAGMLTVLQVTRNYGGAVWHLTAIEIGFSSGMMLGGLLMATWGGFKNRIHTIGLAAAGMGVATLIFGLPIPLFPYLANMFFCGIFIPLFNTPTVVLLQENVDPNYMGRVFGVSTMVQSSMMPLGMLLLGPLADVLPIELLMLFCGTLILICALALVRNKVLVDLGRSAHPKTADRA